MKNQWSVVTIHKSDGHILDGIFVTDCNEKLNRFARAVKPLTVTCSYYESEKHARDFFSKICEGFMNIDPDNFAEYLRSI